MSKTKEELNALKEEVETVNNKLHELTAEELEQVTGGNTLNHPPVPPSPVAESVKIAVDAALQNW